MLKLILFTFFLSGCVSTAPTAPLQSYFYYKPDTLVSFDGLNYYSGVVAAKLTGPLNLYFQSPVAMDRVEITTCSRHVVMKNINPDWFGGSGKTLVYNYAPDSQEMSGMCPLYIQTFSSSVLTSWAMVAFYVNAPLPAHLFCNGVGYTPKGISICSTEATIPQEITFQQSVKMVQKGQCSSVKAVSDKDYLVAPAVGFCELLFSPDGKIFHQMIVHGYSKVL